MESWMYWHGMKAMKNYVGKIGAKLYVYYSIFVFFQQISTSINTLC